jgi:hypothetical protein
MNSTTKDISMAEAVNIESGNMGFTVEVSVGQVFFKYFGFPCNSVHRLLHTHHHHHHLSSGGGIIGPIV